MADDFVLPVTGGILRVDVGRFAGAEIVVNVDVGPATLFAIKRLMERPAGETTDAAASRTAELFDVLERDVLLGWNLVDRHGAPIPTTRDGLGHVNRDLIAEILVLYLLAVGRAPAPLGGPSTVTALSAVIGQRRSRKRASTAGSSTAASSPPPSTANPSVVS
jgi:hypothetical protein